MALIIDGEELDMSPKFWEAFAGWWGDKAYRQAWDAQELELIARECVREEIRKGYAGEPDSGDQWDLGYAQAIRDIIRYLGDAPKTSDRLVWSYGELVPEGEEVDD